MKWIAVIGVTALILLATAVAEAPAQQNPSGVAALLVAALAATPSTSSAFDSLSAGQQKTARALYDAQQRWNPSARLKLTLDQIAARRQSGQGWGEIFNIMKSRGLVKEGRIADVLDGAEHRPRPTHAN
jgi:hypothetical protein